MRFRNGTLLCALAVVSCFPALGWAQSDAETALVKAREAYASQRFDSARDLLLTAAQTDAKNPDIFLLLGRSHYALGELDAAIAAWERTLQLAPEQAYAKQMVAALQGRLRNVETRLQVIRSLLAANLVAEAGVEIAAARKLPLAGEALSDLLSLQAAAALAAGNAEQSLRALRELAVRDPQRTATAEIRLLTGKSLASMPDAPSASQGVAILRALQAELAEAPLGASAELALLEFQLSQAELVVDRLVKWLADHPGHADSPRARRALVEAIQIYLARGAKVPRGPEDTPDALDPADAAALQAAEQALPSLVLSTLQLQIIERVVSHLEQQYVARRAFDVADAAYDRLLAADIAPPVKAALARAKDRSATSRAAAEYQALILRLGRSDAAALNALAKWAAAHPRHALLNDARKRLLDEHLKAAALLAPATPEAALAESEQAALQVAGELLASLKDPKLAEELTQRLLSHFAQRYRDRGAWAAAIAGPQALLELPLPREARYLALRQLAETQTAAALRRIEREVLEGRRPAGPMPDDLAEALATWAQIAAEFPWVETAGPRAAAAAELVRIAESTPPPPNAAQLEPIHQWALNAALSAISAATADETRAGPAATANAVVDRYAELQTDSGGRLAATAHQQLLEHLPQRSPLWEPAMLRQLKLQMAATLFVFRERLRTGRREQIAALDEPQTAMLALAAQLLQSRPAAAPAVLAELQTYLAHWRQEGEPGLADASYALLEEKLPRPQRLQVRLAVASGWVEQAVARHQQLLARGFRPPPDLDELMQKALVRCYEIRATLADGEPLANEASALRQRVIGHYRQLANAAAAQTAILVKAEQPSQRLDIDAQLESAETLLDDALVELDRQARERHPGRRQLELTPAVRESIGRLKTFIVDHPNSPRVGQAVKRWLLVGAHYERFERDSIAAEIAAELEAFAAETPALLRAAPNTPNVAEQAALAGARALHAQALRNWTRQLEADAGADPPAELSGEFKTVLAAYQSITKKYAAGPLVAPAIESILEIALKHAEAGAWDAAASVYVELQQQALPLRRPERLDLARALCVVGKVAPQRALQVLAAVTLWERTPLPASASESLSMLAGAGTAEQPATASPAGQQAAPDADKLGAVRPGANESAADAAKELGGKLDGLVAGKLTENQPPPGGFGGGGLAMPAPNGEFRNRAGREARLLAAIQQQQAAMANRIAMLRDEALRQDRAAPAEGFDMQQVEAVSAVLSEAELQRQAALLDDAYAKLQAIRQAHPRSSAAEQARDEILQLVNHWRSIQQWQRAAELAKRFLADNPQDRNLPAIRHEIARDLLAWAGGSLAPELNRQELLDEVGKRYLLARKELEGIVAAFPESLSLVHAAQWDIANSHLAEARVVARFSHTLARGQFVRAANELLRTAELYHDHPQIGQLPRMLWTISAEVAASGFHEEAIVVWSEIAQHFPDDPLAADAALRIAQTYQSQLHQPLRAAEAYLELNFARGDDVELQNAIFQIGADLQSQKRWVESLHVLETLVDSFPQHPNAGQALSMIGQIHQTNEVWEDAIDAYRRVILDYDQGPWAQQAKWAIAECTINLSLWEEAQGAYRDYQTAYPEDPQIAEATRRLEVLKDLARFQNVVDEVGQRKAFDAQYQIAAIVRAQLANPVKSIIEFKKVATQWPESHLADDALFQVGMIYLELGEPERSREAFRSAADRYPASPLADDALFQIGASYEHDAQQLSGVTRGALVEIAKDIAQKQAYQLSQGNRREQRARGSDEVAQLKREGKSLEADNRFAFNAARNLDFDRANAAVVAGWAAQQEEALTTSQLADRQDKVNAALRKAVAAFRETATIASADKADDALLRMAQIFDQELKDSEAAMATWLEIVKQYSGTTVAEDASWRIAEYYHRHQRHQQAIEAYESFLRNYRRSPRASDAQAAIAESHERLGNWVEAMDAYTNYINNFPEGALAKKAKEQISWIKTYRL